MPIEKENYNYQKIVAIVGVLLFFIKLSAWYITNSVAILTDALEGIVNVIAAFIGLYSLYLSAQPKDKNHPYGHGKAEFISAGVEGVLISFAGIWIIFEAIQHLINPHQLKQLDYGMYLIIFAGVINYLLGYFAIQKGKKNNSIALVSSGKHLISDTLTTVGVVIGLIIIHFTGIIWLDSIVATIFGVIIIFTGIKILRQSVAGIMDEADVQLLNDMIKTLQDNRQPNWIDFHNLRIIKFGSGLHIDCHITVPWYFNVKEAHAEIDNIESLIQQKFGNNIELFVHSDYCKPKSCEICTKVDCDVREKSFVKAITWSLENVVSNEKHHLIKR